MAAKFRSSFKSWVIIYIGLAVAMYVTGPASDVTRKLVSPGSLPSELTADRDFFAPATSLTRRTDI